MLKRRPTIDGSAPLKGRIILSVLTFAITSGLSLTLSSSASHYEAATIVLSLALGVACTFLALNIAAATFSPVYFTSWIYIVFFLIIPGLIHLNIARFPFYNKQYTEQIAMNGANVVLLFVFVFGASYIASARHKIVSPPNLSHSNLSTLRPALLVAALCVLSIAAASIIGFEAIATRRGDFMAARDLSGPAFASLLALARSCSFIALAIAIIAVRDRTSLTAALSLLVAVLVFLVSNNPLSLPRFVLGSYVIGLAFVLFRPGPLIKAGLLVCAGAAQVTVFPLMDALSRQQGISDFRFSPLSYISYHGDFDGFQSTLNVIAMVQSQGLAVGRQLASAILFFVPSSMLPWKSPGTGVDAAVHSGYLFTNISAPLPVEFYADFGYIGLMILSALAGLSAAWVDRMYSKAAGGIHPFSILIPIVTAGFVMILLRGSLVAVVGPFAISLLIAWLSSKVLTSGSEIRRKSAVIAPIRFPSK